MYCFVEMYAESEIISRFILQRKNNLIGVASSRLMVT